jgi:hypothetical protein
MKSEEDDLPSKCSLIDAAYDYPQNSSEEPTSKTIQITGSQKLIACDKQL